MNREFSETISSIKSEIRKSTSDKKGSSGTILIIGGSKYYTGAPYFASLAAFHSGSELVYIFSEPEATVSLKTLLPESIVCGIEYQEWILKKVSCCIMGPGLGRPSEETCKEITRILSYLGRRDIPIVIDGDGIRLASKLDIGDLKTVIITPNTNEQKYIGEFEKRIFYVLKGSNDVILWKDKEVKINNEGCPKRIGGQGDILAGTIASLVSKCKPPSSDKEVFGSIILGCVMVRKAGRLAYEKYWKSLITRDILEMLKESFRAGVEDSPELLALQSRK
ncbi:putative sugar kinase [Encephalitozoon romaleae SJ-2008]|uniref:ATP-dependent (S)-NAD(P)H-hydrate dehydratase n=1 Tax=Encephalitozoon romaleae (strain SJ-2008) TaxID=1178016 RepID=I6ZHS3_ENCRO|nr:putative sugar kinase [Encephalitozoon romaleae SJ-2008]AFN82748.1 putative sugar kinase [Encephalitozoon romaleae SJ-2008]